MSNLASIRNHEYINILLDAEKDLRIAESVCQCEFPLRNYSISMDESWFRFMERNGFLVDGKFLPIFDIINLATKISRTFEELTFNLEAVRPNLSKIVINESKRGRESDGRIVIDMKLAAFNTVKCGLIALCSQIGIPAPSDPQIEQYIFFNRNGVSVKFKPPIAN